MRVEGTRLRLELLSTCRLNWFVLVVVCAGNSVAKSMYLFLMIFFCKLSDI